MSIPFQFKIIFTIFVKNVKAEYHLLLKKFEVRIVNIRKITQ